MCGPTRLSAGQASSTAVGFRCCRRPWRVPLLPPSRQLSRPPRSMAAASRPEPFLTASRPGCCCPVNQS
eukprot:4035187-Prymnesium_polylepis.1